MSERTKKILMATGFLLVVVLIGYLLYTTFFQPTAPPEETSPAITDGEPDTGTLPGSGEAGDRTLIPDPEDPDAAGLPDSPVSPIAIGGLTETTSLTLTGVDSPQLGADGQSLNYYDPSDGRFYTVDRDGNIRALTNNTFPNTDSIVWANDSSQAIVEFPDGANVVVNMGTGDAVTLPTHWEDFDFAPHNQQIISKSIGVDPSNRWLVISNPDGSGAETIAALGNNADKVDVNWSPNDQVVAFSDTGVTVSGFGRKQFLAIGKNQENFPGLVVEGLFFDPIWNDTGSKILYSTSGPASNYQPQIWVTDGQSNTLGDNRRSIALNTWADKCTFQGDIAYCAVPKNLPEGSGLQRRLAIGEPDAIYRVDTRSGSTQIVGEPDNPTSMTNLNVSADGSTLFYQDAINGRLESIRIR